ncbi:MAG TPA: 50S ribosomal protein L35 [Polyangiaceae bacterium]|nr:50S ribosomal protein L35 [Polyangiaceae bacterium]
MPKRKTNRAAAKRFKITGTGKVRRHRCGHRHGMINKSRSRNRRLAQGAIVHPHMEKRVKLLLPYA